MLQVMSVLPAICCLMSANFNDRGNLMKEITDNYVSSMVNDLIELINIPTVNGHSDCEGPFGYNIARGLNYVLDMGKRFGFKSKNFDGYAGEITVGDGPRVIGILCHVDVVDAGSGWSTDPFRAVIRDKRVYGRGAVDDKGPLISCLYAMKYLADEGMIPDNTAVRMIVGTDEETGWRGMSYYTKLCCHPNVSFTPDGNFPLIYGEKGVYSFKLSYKCEVSAEMGAKVKILSLEGGVAGNSVPSHAVCRLRVESGYVRAAKERAEAYIAEVGCKANVEVSDEGIVINVFGKGAHAMSPEKGENAISNLMNILGVYCEDELQEYRLIEAYNEYIGMDYYGRLFGCAECDGESGRLTFNVGKMHTTDEGRVEFIVNIRYPVTMSFDRLSSIVLGSCDKANFEYSFISHLPPVFFDRDGSLISALFKSYQCVTGDEISQPITIGGATYARAMPNTVAFGPVFPWEDELAHMADEYISMESLERMMAVYAHAILALADVIG